MAEDARLLSLKEAALKADVQQSSPTTLITVQVPTLIQSNIFKQMQQRQSQKTLHLAFQLLSSACFSGVRSQQMNLMKPMSALKNEPKQTDPMCLVRYLYEVSLQGDSLLQYQLAAVPVTKKPLVSIKKNITQNKQKTCTPPRIFVSLLISKCW